MMRQDELSARSFQEVPWLTKPALPEFRVHDTGLDIFRDDLTIVKASDGLGWSSVHALVAQQAQNGKIPYEHIHKATPDMWLAAAFDEISIVRTVSGVDHREKQPANITSITGAGVECRDLLYSPTTALHVYVKADVITEVADALFRGNREFAVASVLAAEDPVLRAMLQAIRDALFEPAHFIMEWKMMRHVRTLAERTRPAAVALAS